MLSEGEAAQDPRRMEQAAVAVTDLSSTRLPAIDDLKWMQRAIERTLSRVIEAISGKEIFRLLRSLNGDMNLFSAQCVVKFGLITVKSSSAPISIHG